MHFKSMAEYKKILARVDERELVLFGKSWARHKTMYNLYFSRNDNNACIFAGIE